MYTPTYELLYGTDRIKTELITLTLMLVIQANRCAVLCMPPANLLNNFIPKLITRSAI